MKKLLLTTTIFLSFTILYGQSTIYHPFPDTNAFWSDVRGNIFNPWVSFGTVYGINGDTLINGKNYKKIYSLSDSTITNSLSTYYAAIREQSKRIYTVIGTFPEQVLYDFNLSVGDTIVYNFSIFPQSTDTFSRVVTKIDSILLLNSKYRKRFTLVPAQNYSLTDIVVEGIGSISWWGLFNPLVRDKLTNGDNYTFECFKQNNTVLYLNSPTCNRCFCIFATDINHIEEKERLSFSPNPFSTQTTFQTDILFNNASFTVYNTLGQKVKQINNISGQTVTLFGDNLPSGIYFFLLTANNNTFKTGKLVMIDN